MLHELLQVFEEELYVTVGMLAIRLRKDKETIQAALDQLVRLGRLEVSTNDQSASCTHCGRSQACTSLLQLKTQSLQYYRRPKT